MGSSAKTEYCAFTKAVEHLGDRWSLLIIRELFMFGPQGFNTLAIGLPGRISRSVLAARMRKLCDLGLVARVPSEPAPAAPYQLTPAGQQLIPTLQSLWQRAEHWIPGDPAMAARDPSIILWWLVHRIDRRALPGQQIAVEFELRVGDADRQWLLLAAGSEPELCHEDPLIGEEQYVRVDAEAEALYPVSRGGPLLARCAGRRLHPTLRRAESREVTPHLVQSCPGTDPTARARGRGPGPVTADG